MAVKKVKAEEYTCDGCGAPQLVVDRTDVTGFEGTVVATGDWGGSGAIPFFACAATCLQDAIVNAIQRGMD